MSYNRVRTFISLEIKYLPSAYKTQVECRSHFSGKSASYVPRNTVIPAKKYLIQVSKFFTFSKLCMSEIA